jgi:hypothetical protein
MFQNEMACMALMASNEAELGGVTRARAVALDESNMAGTAQDSTWHFYAK